MDLDLILDAPCRTAFFAYAARHTPEPLALSLNGSRLRLPISPELAADWLSVSAFPVRERALLRHFLHRYFSAFDEAEQEEILAAACAFLEQDAYRGCPAGGPGREVRIRERMLPHLHRGYLDFSGFCDFALGDYRPYLRFVLEMAADQVLAAAEQEEYHALLGEVQQRMAKPGLHATLRFYPDGFWQLTRSDQSGEGGSLALGEELLLSALLAPALSRLLLEDAEQAPLYLLDILFSMYGDGLVLADSHGVPLDTEISR